jgi:beta-mannosidase
VIGRGRSGRSAPLGGEWSLAAVPPGAAAHPDDLERLRPDWTPCAGPVPAAAALRSAGVWTLDTPRNFDADDWWYRCRFSVDSPDEPARLGFEGLATLSDAWLNGVHILHSDSMFASHQVDVTALIAQDNALVLRFHALLPLLVERRPRARWKAPMISHQALRWWRTTLLGRMPSWCPPIAPVGPWRPIVLHRGSISMSDLDVRTAIRNEAGIVAIACSLSAGAHRVRGRLHVDGHAAELDVDRIDGTAHVRATVRVPDVTRWWPHTHGDQSLYNAWLTIVTERGDEIIDLGRIGFRTLAVDRGADGRGFGLVVNDVPVFCRGVCWTPLDLAELTSDADTYRDALRMLRDCGMNIVRIGGTMVYEDRAFYDACDALGILVWQDLMFANMDYPADEPFVRGAVREADTAAASLQGRPSVAVVCGSSEVLQQAAMFGVGAEHRTNPLFDDRLSAAVTARLPDAIWMPSTPSGGTWPFQPDTEVSHYYGVGAYRRELDDARRAGVRFAAECLAFSNVPEPRTVTRVLGGAASPDGLPTWKAAVPRDAGTAWDFEDVRDHYVRLLFDVNPAALRARDPDRYLALGRVATAEAMHRTFSEWRRPQSSCRGGVVWFARDLQPGAGWGLVDAYGLPKAAYWYLRRTLAPIAVLASDEGLNGLWLHAINDTKRPLDAELFVDLYRTGARRESAAAHVPVAAHATTSVHADAMFERFLDLTHAYRFSSSGFDVVVVTLRDRATSEVVCRTHAFPCGLPALVDPLLSMTPALDEEPDGYVLTVDAQRLAYAVAIRVDGWTPDDNYFHLAPGEQRRIRLRGDKTGALPHGHVTALNAGGVFAIRPAGIARAV